MSALIGYFVGFFLAAAGIGYLWLAILRLIRVRKHWPRASYWSAVTLTAVLGCATAAESQNPGIAALATVAAVAFMVWRGRANQADVKPAAQSV